MQTTKWLTVIGNRNCGYSLMMLYWTLTAARAAEWVVQVVHGLTTKDVPGQLTVFAQFILQFTQNTIFPLHVNTLHVKSLQLPSKVDPLCKLDTIWRTIGPYEQVAVTFVATPVVKLTISNCAVNTENCTSLKGSRSACEVNELQSLHFEPTVNPLKKYVLKV